MTTTPGPGPAAAAQPRTVKHMPLSPAEVADAAWAIALAAHADQVDAAGAPYIGHLTRVAAHAETIRAACAPHLDPHLIRATALLHDAIEDTRDNPEGTRVTAETLRAAGIPDSVIEDIERLTHTPHQPRVQYLQTVMESDGSTVVKLADTLDNTDPARRRILIAIDPTRAARLDAKYQAQEATLRGRLNYPPAAQAHSR
jgi:(p)ppGpp synthase/HD superfamily hydrolase